MQYGSKLIQKLIPDIKSVLLKVNTDNNSYKLNNFVLQKLVDFVQQGKNADDDDEVQDYLLKFVYSVDFNDLLDNIDSWLQDQKKRDFLMQVLLLNNITVNFNNEEKIVNFLNKMFETSKYDSEKQQIAELAVSKFSLNSNFLNKNIYKFYSNLSSKNSEFYNSFAGKMKIIEKKTNGFFVDPDYGDKNRIKENNSIFYVISDIINKKSQEEEEEKEKQKSQQVATELINIIEESLFEKINPEDLENDDYIREYQLKKAKIFLILKTVNSKFFRESDLEKSKEIIEKIIALKSNEIDNLSTFSENCDFNISSLAKNDLFSEKNLLSINYRDIIDCTGSLGEVERKELNNILFDDTEYEDVSFIELPNTGGIIDDNLFYYKKDDNKKMLIYFFPSQKEKLLSTLYNSKNLLKERKIIGNECDEIGDFVKICSKVSGDSDCKSILDVYNAYYLTEENNCLGSLNNDASFSIKVNSNNNRVRRDVSNVLISTKVLLEWLKVQSLGNSPLREMKVSVTDIENLPSMLNEYYDFILDKKSRGHMNLTPVDNLVIKNAKMFISDYEANKFFKKLDSNWKNCFLSLKIDDAFLAEKVKKSQYFKKNNQYVFFGSNDNFFSLEAKKKKLSQNRLDLFDAKDKKQTNLVYERIGDENDPDFDKSPVLYSKPDIKQNIQSITDRSINILSGNKNGVNHGDINVAVNLDTDLDVDVDIEMLMGLLSSAKDGSHLNKNDLINHDNVNSQVKIFIENGKFPPEIANFFKILSKKLDGNFKQFFNLIANRRAIVLESLKNKNFKGSNFQFTPDAFAYEALCYLNSGIAYFNGEYGDPKLSVHEIKENGEPIYVVAKTIKHILDDEYSHPVKEMIARIPISKVGVDNETLNESFKENIESINSNLEILDTKLKSIDRKNIQDLFFNNPIKYSTECGKYISDNKDEILEFLDRISENNEYKNICDSVCHNFCVPEVLNGVIRKEFSVIDPVKFIRGLSKIFDFLEELRELNFIDDSFLRDLNNTLKKTKNHEAIRTVYRMIVEQKINIEKQIILFRNLRNKKREYIDIDINDVKEVNRYFKEKKNSIGEWKHFEREDRKKEITFSRMCFNNILSYMSANVDGLGKYMQYGQDVYLLNNHSDCGGLFDKNLFNEDIRVKLFSDADASFTINFSKSDDDDREITKFRECACKLYYFLNKKYKRYQNGRIDDSSLSETEKFFIENKVDVLTRLNSYVNNGIADGDEKFKLAYIFVFSILNCIKDGQYYDVLNEIDDYMEVIENKLSNKEIDTLFEKISKDKDNAMMYLSSVSFSKSNPGNVNYRKSGANLIKEIRLIEENKTYEFRETIQRQKKFLAKCWQIFLYNIKNNNINYPFKKKKYNHDFELYLNGLSYEFAMYRLCEKIYAVGNNEEREKEFKEKVAEYILSPDIEFESVLKKIYTNITRYYNGVTVGNELDERNWIKSEDILKYCFAINNNGVFSLLSNLEKNALKNLSGEKREQHINELVHETHKFLKDIKDEDLITVLKKISFSVRHGAKYEDILREIKHGGVTTEEIIGALLIHSKSEEMMKKNSFKEILLFLSSIKEEVGLTDDKVKPKDGKFSLNCIDKQFKEMLPKFVIFLNSNIISASQREYYINGNDNGNIKKNFYVYFDNFTSLLEKLDRYFLEKDKNISFNNERISQLLAKAHDLYITETEKEVELSEKEIGEQFKKINKSVDYILNIMERVRVAYSEAVDVGDVKKQTVLINLSGKINFLMDDFSLDDTVDFLKMIEKNLTSDLNILNKFDFLKEHYLRSDYKDEDKKKKAYDDVTELYNVTNNENTFLSTNLSHKNVMMISDSYKEKEQKTKSLKLAINKKVEKLCSNLKNFIDKKRGDTSDSNFSLKNFKTELKEIANIALKAEERIIGEKETGRMLLKKIKNNYELSEDNLFRNENLVFYQKIAQGDEESNLNEQTESVKAVVGYVSDVCSAFMKYKGLAEEVLNECAEKISKNEKISADEQLNFIAAYCFKHIEDQGKMLRSNQIALATLRNIFLLRNVNRFQEGSDSLHLIGLMRTGGGKTITIKLNAFIASLKGKTAFITEPNDTLLYQIMADLGKDSFYKGRIFLIDEDSNLVSVSDNKVVPADKVFSVIKDNRNLILTTNSRLNFWRRKLWYLYGEQAPIIASFLRKKGHLCVDEFDNLADPKTSNKISITSKGGAKKYYLALALQKCYNCLLQNGLLEIDKDDQEDSVKKIKGFFSSLKGSYDPNDLYCIGELTNELKRIEPSFNGDYDNMSNELFEVFCENILACITANNLKEGKDFIIEIDSSTGYYDYSPINKGEPKKNGEKYSEKIDLALRVLLKENYGFNCKGLMNETQIISNESSFHNYRFFGSSFNVSGSVEGIKDFYEDFYVESIGSEDISNVSVENNPITGKCISGYTGKDDKNCTLRLTFLLFCLKRVMKNCSNEEGKQKIIAFAGELIEKILDEEGIEGEVKNSIADSFIGSLAEPDKTDYTLTYCRDSKELKHFSDLLEKDLKVFRDFAKDERIITKIPKVIRMDKSIRTIDNFTEIKKMEKAREEDGAGAAVFALPDTERGFDFTGSPRVIITDPTDVARNIQVIGRTGRNTRPGAVTLSYAFKDGDIEEFFKEEKTKDYIDELINASSEKCYESVKEFLKMKSKSKIELFKDKKDFFLVTGIVSEKLSIFTNLILKRCGKKSIEFKRDAFKIISEFQRTIEEKFRSYPNDIEYERKISDFKQNVYKDLDRVLEKIYKHSFVVKNLKQSTFEELIEEMESSFSETFNSGSKKIFKDTEEDEDYIKNEVELDADNLKLLKDKHETINNDYYRDDNYFKLKMYDEDKKLEDFRFSFNDLNGIDKGVFGIFGVLNGCEYDIKNYRYKDFSESYNEKLKKNNNNNFFDYDGDIIVAKKDVLSKSGAQLKTEKREVIMIKGPLSSSNMDVLKSKLSTLSPNAMVIFDFRGGEQSFFSYPKFNSLLASAKADYKTFCDLSEQYFTSKVNDINNVIYEQLTEKLNYDGFGEKEKGCIIKMLQIEVCKYYTEHNKMPDEEYLTNFLDRKLKSFIGRIGEFALKGKNKNEIKEAEEIKIKKGLDKYINGYTKSGFLFAKKKGILSYTNSKKQFFSCAGKKPAETLLEQEQMEELCEKYYSELNDINFNIDLSSQDIENLTENKEKISTIFKRKLFFIISKAEEFKKKLEKEDNLQLADKESLLKNLNDVLSEDNIVKATNRFMDIFAIVVSDQNILAEVDKLTKIFDISNIDNIYDIDSKLSEIEKNFQTAEEKLKLKEIFASNEKNTSNIVYKQHNNIVDLINTLRSKINKVKKYKNEIDSLENEADSFEGFDTKESIEYTKEEIDSRKFRYNKMFNEIANYNDFKLKDKLSLLENMIDKNISSLVGLIMTPENISKVINEFTLNNYDPNNTDNLVFFGSKSCGEVENKLINGIIDLYKKRFGEISNAAGGASLMEICKEKYNKLIEDNDNNNDNDEEEEEKDKKEKVKEISKDDFGGFKNDVVELMKSVFSELSKNKNEDPNIAYDVIKNMLTGLEENYETNAKKHDDIKNDIINTINSVANRFKKVDGIHDEFEKDLCNIIKETLAGSGGLSEEEIKGKIKGLMSGKLVKELDSLLKDASIPTLKKIQELLSVAVGNDMSRTKEMVKKLEEDKNFPFIFVVIIAVISLGTIFLTKEGKSMFRKKKINKEKKHLETEIKPKEYFIRSNSKENQLADSLKDINGNLPKDVDVIDKTQSKLMPIKNKVQDNLSNSKLQNAGTLPVGG